MKQILSGIFVALMTFCMVFPAGADEVRVKRDIVVYNWSEYIPDDVLEDFTSETGVRVTYSTYESNEAMFAKVKLLGGRSYDVVCPSSYMADLMIKAGMLRKLDHSRLPELANIDPKLMAYQAHDPQGDYSVPYMWGTLGLVINTKYIPKGSVTRWSDLWRPEFKGKILLTDDSRDAFGVALKVLGKDVNTTSEADIAAAYGLLEKLHPSVRVFDVTAAKQALVSEEVIIGTIWNGDALVAKEENPHLEFIYPEEGAIIWVDSFVILNRTDNLNNAYKFINFMLRPDISARCVEEYMYSSPNVKTWELLDEELRSNRVLNPLPEDLENSEVLISVGSAQSIYERYWERVKTLR